MNPRAIPVFINSFNRLDCLARLVLRLEQARVENIFILDNQSAYPPLLEYLARSPHQVLYLRRNFGYLALWESGLYDRFRKDPVVYTDPDVIPDEKCPDDFLEHFHALLQRYPDAQKVGFGLRIDDLPATYPLRLDVIAHEQGHWLDPVAPGVYRAPIDTTFALYRPGTIGGFWQPALRTGGPYVARHLPWYVADRGPTPEDEFYRSQIARGGTHWSGLS